MHRRQALTGLAAVLAAGCAPRPGPQALQPRAPAAGSALTTIHVATSRMPYAQPSRGFSPFLGHGLALRDYDLAVPADPQALPAVLAERRTDVATLARRLAPSSRVVVFVHGYNRTYQEALFDAARLRVSADLAGEMVLFSWPSAGRTVEYVADRDAALGSRDDLAQVLDAIAARRSDLLLFGHSMGAWLTMEALGILRAAGRSTTLSRIETVLAAPDIDVALFAEQLRDVGPLSRPITVLVSPGDRALAASAQLGNRTPRLGALSVGDPRVVRLARRADLRIVDISALPAGDLGHSGYVALARHIGKLERSEPPRLVRAGAYVLDIVDKALVP